MVVGPSRADSGRPLFVIFFFKNFFFRVGPSRPESKKVGPTQKKVGPRRIFFWVFFFLVFFQPIIVKFAIFSDLVDKKNFPPGKGRSSTVQGWWFPFLSPLDNYFLHALVFVKLRERHPAII